MYYDRTISTKLEKLISNVGNLRWLFDFVKNHSELDFLIGKNNSKEWISVYRGLTRIVTFHLMSDYLNIKLDAANKYKKMYPGLYGIKSISYNFQNDLRNLINQIINDKNMDRYYKNKKEGYYQNELSRMFGICGKISDDFVIIDKEAIIGYANQQEKDNLFGGLQQKYKQLQKEISLLNPARYGKDLGKKAIGNELDFLALNKDGNILLIEYKHGTNTSGIYLSPLQIGLYYDIFTNYPKADLEKAIIDMLKQKQNIGLINSAWPIPKSINQIIPILIISEYNDKSSAKIKFDEIMKIARSKYGANFLSNLKTYNYTSSEGLKNW